MTLHQLLEVTALTDLDESNSRFRQTRTCSHVAIVKIPKTEQFTLAHGNSTSRPLYEFARDKVKDHESRNMTTASDFYMIYRH